MALGRSARSSTISTTKACRAGVSNALITPCTICSTMMSGTVIDVRRTPAPPAPRDCSEREHLRHDEDAVPIPPVHEHARERREEKRRNLPAEPDDAEEQFRAGQAIDQPARGDARDPGPDEREALAAEEEAVIAVPKRSREPAGAEHPLLLLQYTRSGRERQIGRPRFRPHMAPAHQLPRRNGKRLGRRPGCGRIRPPDDRTVRDGAAGPRESQNS